MHGLNESLGNFCDLTIALKDIQPPD